MIMATNAHPIARTVRIIDFKNRMPRRSPCGQSLDGVIDVRGDSAIIAPLLQLGAEFFKRSERVLPIMLYLHDTGVHEIALQPGVVRLVPICTPRFQPEVCCPSLIRRASREG